jgi:hypothetical protein
MPEVATTSVRVAEALDPRTFFLSDGWAGYVPSEPLVAHQYVLTDSAVPARELLERMNDDLARSDTQTDVEATTEELGAAPVAAAVGWVGEAPAARPNAYQRRTAVASHRRHGFMGMLENALRRRR